MPGYFFPNSQLLFVGDILVPRFLFLANPVNYGSRGKTGPRHALHEGICDPLDEGKDNINSHAEPSHLPARGAKSNDHASGLFLVICRKHHNTNAARSLRANAQARTLVMMAEETGLQKILERFAERVREKRRALHLTQENLAERAGLSVCYVAQIEICLRTPSLRTLAALASALECDISDLLAPSPDERWKDENYNLLRSLQGMSESDVRFVLDQLQAIVRYLKWERDNPHS